MTSSENCKLMVITIKTCRVAEVSIRQLAGAPVVLIGRELSERFQKRGLGDSMGEQTNCVFLLNIYHLEN